MPRDSREIFCSVSACGKIGNLSAFRENWISNLARRFRGGIVACDAALHDASSHPVHAEAAGRFTATIEAWNDVAVQVDHLTFGIDAQPGARIMNHGRGPGRMKRSRLNFELWAWLSEVRIFAVI